MDLPAFKLASKSTATTYRFVVEDPSGGHHGGWACCTVNDATGELNIMSDWGNWAYRWNVAHLGSKDRKVALTEFLSDRTSFDYLADKLTSDDDARAFDADATLERCRELLLVARRHWMHTNEQLWTHKDYRRGAPYDRDDQPPLDKDLARRLWDDDLPSLCRDAEGHCGSAGEWFVDHFFQVEGSVWISKEPWELIRERPTHAYNILKGAILPALSAACSAEHAARTAPQVCTCLGSCKGAAGLAPGWKCALEGAIAAVGDP